MPLLWVSLAFLCGILLAASLTLPTAAWLGLAALALPLASLNRISIFLTSRFPSFSRLRLPRLPGKLAQTMVGIAIKLQSLSALIPLSLLPLFLLLGAARYQAAQPRLTPESLAWYNDQAGDVELEGVVVRAPDERDTYTNLRVRVESLRALDSNQTIEVEGLLLARGFRRGRSAAPKGEPSGAASARRACVVRCGLGGQESDFLTSVPEAS